MRTTDAGRSWMDTPRVTSSTLFAVSFSDENNGTAVGSNGTILRTTDGGIGWVNQLSGSNAIFFGVSFANQSIGITVGFVTAETSDGGANWVTRGSATEILYGVSLLDTNVATAVGTYGTILQSTPPCLISQILSPKAVLIKDVRLDQNYPNPFNSVTMISFTLVNRSYLTLRIYDILGNSVANLFEGTKEPGTYNISWDGGGAASGVYYYRLQSDSFIQTKKFILLK